MSSRNAYLNRQERTAATVLYKALQAGRLQFKAHPHAEASLAVRAMIDTVETESCVHLDYAEVRDPDSFMQLEVLSCSCVTPHCSKGWPSPFDR